MLGRSAEEASVVLQQAPALPQLSVKKTPTFLCLLASQGYASRVKGERAWPVQTVGLSHFTDAKTEVRPT